jgi:hypothetical protein
MWEFLVCEAFVRHFVDWHRESYVVAPSAEARAGASVCVRAAFSTRKAYGLSRE